MKCPYCGSRKDKVIDSRSSNVGRSVRRRRECLKCERRFTTYEYIEEIPLMVVKKGGRREPFDRKKLLAGIMKACEKRPIAIEKQEELCDKVEKHIQRGFEKEVESKEIGELVMKHLYNIDEIAYVRFASVYRQFRDVSQFMKELKKFLK
ncbi:MAG: transcriptional repressor NrdR [Candidatus Omnitrophica bacterium]|nr:transcriptional repressor NrdR [Candidatus Omnitrophota bacterium]